MKTKKCKDCREEKPATIEFFYKHKGCKLNLSTRCIICMKQWRKNNKEKIREYSKKSYENNKDKNQAYRDANKDKKREYDKKYRERNKKKLSSYRSQYYKDNKEKLNNYRKKHYEENKSDYIANSAKRKANKRNQTPKFANLKLISRIYKFCPEGHHVEHMVPLKRGGFHHESNLCYLPSEINLEKSMKTIEEFGQDKFNKHVLYWQDILI